ncbi:MFS transporter [Maridesulfovibrio hydrothermalis]|uniref:Putative Major facilitator superfamily MFS_1 n=1 Tax=Maridesulfovibrio hydrothermalis AM13 = DSM 14728 TaxID=1121451 RepID=L0RE46_9BACT|nr:MFS transporter [Maridesulfovibrio hydrothermalis]CCO24450.1 putative Major facilitator superfamily MFS_1 [Maridesulfovibrio hydrothermalis AM13 = DSM 14728]
MKPDEKLFNLGFIILSGLVLFLFINLAVFYSLYNYLETLPIARQWHGLLIGLLSLTALILRPFIITVLTPHNAIRGITSGLLLIIVSLLLYEHIDSFTMMFLLRILHGAAYVLAVSSAVTLLIIFLPPQRSGQGFGVISIVILLPFALVPLVVEKIFTGVSPGMIYSYTAVFMVPPLLLVIPLSRELKKRTGTAIEMLKESLPKGSIKNNISQPDVLCLLIVNAVISMVYALIFYFLKTFCTETGLGNSGLFFSIAMGTMVVLRLLLGPLLDRFNKAGLTIGSLLVMTVGLLLLIHVDTIEGFYFTAVVYGTGVGIAVPLMNSLMFIISRPDYRGLNTNLMLEMVDAGYFVGPALCGFAIASGLSRITILYCCAGLLVAAACMLLFFLRLTKAKERVYD